MGDDDYFCEGEYKVFCIVVTYNHAAYIKECLQALNSLDCLTEIVVVDNNSDDDSVAQIISSNVSVKLLKNSENIGFCAANNQALAHFMASKSDWVLLINPDLNIEPKGVRQLLNFAAHKFKESSLNGAYTGKVLRYDDIKIIDTVGISFSSTLRHFDRGADLPDTIDSYCVSERISGISGAFLLMHRQFVCSLEVPPLLHEADVDRLYPALRVGRAERINFFDEAFFAYREDAELALRASKMGLFMWYHPVVVGYHHRRVTPSRRQALTGEINKLGVRNRFLLQILHFSPLRQPGAIVPGLIIRNLIVIFGVFLRERTSIVAFRELRYLWKRAWERRKYFNGS